MTWSAKSTSRGRFLDGLRAFQFDNATVKVDWSLDAPIPWTAPMRGERRPLHVADDMDALTRTSAQLARGLIPDRPLLVMGQYSMVDETRQPDGKETAWAYTHVPQRVRGDAVRNRRQWDQRSTDVFVGRIEAEIERRAPGFRDLIRARHVFTPPMLQEANSNLVGGSVNQGTAQIHQQLVFRPTPGLARAETPIRGLYLAGASAHPGGGVHGAAGANAARGALRPAQRYAAWPHAGRPAGSERSLDGRRSHICAGDGAVGLRTVGVDIVHMPCVSGRTRRRPARSGG